jgi:DNA helicase-2/ATP-dependent DNA helicase PcrA
MMSVHAAKGLEFKSIFVVGLEEKLFPSFRATDDMDQMDEERRLFYVAITRAETNLTLTYANSRYKFGEMKYNKPSRFLLEISPSHLHDAGGGATVQGGGATIAAKRMSSGVIGNFKKRKMNRVNEFKIDPKDFKPSPGSAIEEGMEVLHMKFGKGKVINIDGNEKNKVATILFENIDSPQRRLMLKFAKLQIVE